MRALRMDPSDFAAELREEIANNRIRLPTLPDVALRVKAAVENECSARELAGLIAEDIAMSARLIQLANSPLYRGSVEVESIQVAVTRLGTKMVRGFVIVLAMRQMFNTSSDILAKSFREVWQDGVQVAAISRVLADTSPKINREEAMLAGLLHNIGALPILARLDDLHADDIDASTVHQLIEELAPETGTRILQSWKLPEPLIAVPEGCHRLDRNSGPEIDYADIVLASRLQYLFTQGLLEVTQEMSNLPALKKLGIQFETVILDQASAATWATRISESIGS